MSHDAGTVKFPDGTTMHYEYDGTADVALSHLYDTYEEMRANWRKGTWLRCTCGKDEEVTIATDYGGGDEWDGRACRHCRAITQGLSPSYNDFPWIFP